ncbi:MAG: cation/multidrug efflux pump [Gammaproteobacteria bacterium]
MPFTALIVALALAGILFLILAVRRLRRRRLLGGSLHGATALIFVLLSICAVMIAANLRTYQRLSFEQPAGELQLTRTADRQYNAVLTYPSGEHASFALRGDEWQVDARVLKWHAFANLVGFDTAYRLERIGGRYSRIEDERAQARTVYSLNPTQRIDPWDLVHRYHSWIPWMDALYGSATFLPMADGALYEIKVSQSGLVARPLNQAARDAVGSWH